MTRRECLLPIGAQAKVPITFTDDDGVVWDVWEAARTRPVIRGDVTRMTPSVEEGYLKGLLCFLSARGKRRLEGYPRYWSVLSEGALKRLCLMAEAVPHSEIRSPEDQSGVDLFLGGPDTPGQALEHN
jgi:hypothetical protein